MASFPVERPRYALDHRAAHILDYLQHNLPGYPFDIAIDTPFVEELLEDFPHLDLLEQVKAFRWFHDNAPCGPRVKNPRLALRRWMARAWSP